MEISEVQDIVYHNLQRLKTTSNASTISLLDYFVPRQYINLYSRNFITFALQKLGESILNFVDLIDVSHPDVPFAYQGIFNLSSDFSKRIIECLEVAKLAQSNNLNLIIPVLVDDLRKKYPKLIKYMGDVAQYVRLIKDPVVRNNIRSIVSSELDLRLAHRIWPTIPATFEPYVLSATSEYHGFKRISMTNAAVILCKIAKCYKSSIRVKSPTNNQFSKILKFLDECPSNNNKPLFDNFWQIDVERKLCVLLGEREKKCYFIICC